MDELRPRVVEMLNYYNSAVIHPSPPFLFLVCLKQWWEWKGRIISSEQSHLTFPCQYYYQWNKGFWRREMGWNFSWFLAFPGKFPGVLLSFLKGCQWGLTSVLGRDGSRQQGIPCPITCRPPTRRWLLPTKSRQKGMWHLHPGVPLGMIDHDDGGGDGLVVMVVAMLVVVMMMAAIIYRESTTHQPFC